MQRAPTRAEGPDLRAAGEAVGDHDRARIARADRRDQHAPGDRPRDFEVPRVVAERSRHPAASGVQHFELKSVNPAQDRDFALKPRDRLLMAMTLEYRLT